MNVGKDPFPRDEVTGLAAFDHLEPLRSHDVVPDESVETPVIEDETPAVTESGFQARVPSASNTQRDRVDVTLPLNLSAIPHQQVPSSPSPSASQSLSPESTEEQASGDADDDASSALDAEFEGLTITEPAALDDSLSHAPEPQAAELAPLAAAPSALDAMMQAAAGDAGWDDEDAATRVHSHPAGRAPSEASLDMEWDEEEPATEMRPFALFDTPPLAARQDEWNGADDATSTYLPPRGGTGIRSATPTIRAITPPLQTTLPPPELGASALNGGRPSPFPTTPLVETPDSLDRDERDEARASAFDGLLPVPAPELPTAKTAAEPRELTQLPERFIDALKAGHRPSIAIAASAAVGLVALVLIVRALAAGAVGTAVLEVSPADAQVQVDGKPVSGTSSPYTASELMPGDHEIVVTKPGYNEYRGTFPVSAGANTKLPVIELMANLRDVGFSVRSVPTAASIWVDGEPTEQVTPAKITGIKPGIHRLTLKHEGYSDYELQMFVPEATVLQLPAAELVALPAPPAEPERIGRRSRRALRADEAEPYSSRRSRRSEASAERASYTSSYSARRSRAVDSEDDLSPRASAADSGRMGTLRLNSRPWAQVTLDGRPIGNTPQQNLQLSPGKHKLQLSNPQLGLTKSVTVHIKAGETQTQVINLAE